MKKPRLGLVTRREIKGYVFLLPWILGFLFFFAIPAVKSLYYSFHTIYLDMTSVQYQFVGWGNYAYAFQEGFGLVQTMLNFMGQSVLQVAVILVLGLVLALMLNRPIKGKGVFRTIFFLPIIAVSGPVLHRLVSVGATAVPIIESYGISAIVTAILPAAIAKPLVTLFSQLILVLWYAGVPILIYMTGLQKIDRSIYDAALIDGASGWVVFWKITLPSLRSFIMINGVYSLVFLATNGSNEVIDTLRTNMFTSPTLAWGGYGKVCAYAWIYALMMAALILLIILLARERKAKQVEIVKTRERVQVEKLHAQRAARRKGGGKHGQ